MIASITNTKNKKDAVATAFTWKTASELHNRRDRLRHEWCSGLLPEMIVTDNGPAYHSARLDDLLRISMIRQPISIGQIDPK